MHICIFEDEFYRKLLPLVHFRPVYDLKCGITSLREKITRRYPHAELVLHVRDYLMDVVSERNPGVSVNEMPSSAREVLFVNGRLLMSDKVKNFVGEKYPGRGISSMRKTMSSWPPGFLMVTWNR